MKEKISLAFGAGTFSRPGPRPDRSRGRRRPAPLRSYLAVATGEREPPNMADRTRQTPTRLRHEVTTRNFRELGFAGSLAPQLFWIKSRGARSLMTGNRFLWPAGMGCRRLEGEHLSSSRLRDFGNFVHAAPLSSNDE